MIRASQTPFLLTLLSGLSWSIAFIVSGLQRIIPWGVELAEDETEHKTLIYTCSDESNHWKWIRLVGLNNACTASAIWFFLGRKPTGGARVCYGEFFEALRIRLYYGYVRHASGADTRIAGIRAGGSQQGAPLPFCTRKSPE